MKRGYERASKEDITPIEKGIPIPSRADQNTLYPLHKLEPGDSFTIPMHKLGSVKSNIVRHRKVYPNQEFTHRKEGERVRVWRVK